MKLFEELTLFIAPRNQEPFKDLVDIDEFFVAVDKSGKSPELFKLFRFVSTVTISNAEVERNFSRSKLIITKHMSNLKERNFNARKRIISGMKFFGNDVVNFPLPTSLISKVHHAHRDYKRKMDDTKAEQEIAEKRLRLNNEITAQIQASEGASSNYSKRIESATAEAGKLKKDLEVERKTLEGFLNEMATCKDPDKFHELATNSKLSTTTISQMDQEFNVIQSKILKLQENRIQKLTKK